MTAPSSAPAAASTARVFCTACGKPNNAGARFCRSCGTAMAEVAAAAPPPIPVPLQPTVTPAPVLAASEAAPAPAKTSRRRVARIALLLVLLALALFWWLQRGAAAPAPVATPQPIEEFLPDERPAAVLAPPAAAPVQPVP